MNISSSQPAFLSNLLRIKLSPSLIQSLMHRSEALLLSLFETEGISTRFYKYIDQSDNINASIYFLCL